MLDTLKLITVDWARYNPYARTLASRLMELQDRAAAPSSSDAYVESLERLTRAARGTCNDRHLGGLEQRIAERMTNWDPTPFEWGRFFPHSGLRRIQKALILKPPVSESERGVLFIAFEDNWIRLLRHADLAAFSRDYDLVLSPTWSPPHDLAMLLANKLFPRRLYSILSSYDDAPAFERLFPNIRTVPLLASSWVNPDTFAPPAHTEKRYDVFVLANFAEYKRHFALFRALRGMRRKYRVVLVGGAWGGRTKADLEREARMFGIADQVEVKEGLGDAEMIDAMHQSRTSIIYSMREGACVAVAESLFADVPVGILRGAAIGSRAFINDNTGCLLDPGRVSDDLERFIAESPRYRPRQWMLDAGNGCMESSSFLNETIRAACVAEGKPWTVDLAPMQWRPNAEFARIEDAARLAPYYAMFAQAYGLDLEPTRRVREQPAIGTVAPPIPG